MQVTTMVATIMYPVTSHCAVMESTPYSPMMDKSAMLTRFSLKPARNALPYNAASSMTRGFPCMKNPFMFNCSKDSSERGAVRRRLDDGGMRAEKRMPRSYCNEMVFAFVIGSPKDSQQKKRETARKGVSAPFALGEARCISRARNGCVWVIRFAR